MTMLRKRRDPFEVHGITYIDYHDEQLLRRHLNPFGKLNSHRRTGAGSSNQRRLAQAVKRARFMAILPYVTR